MAVGEDRRDYETAESTSAGRWWLVWVSGARKWVLGSTKAVNAACLAVFGPSTNSALSRQLGSAKKFRLGVFPSCVLDMFTNLRRGGLCRRRRPIRDAVAPEAKAQTPLKPGHGRSCH